MLRLPLSQADFRNFCCCKWKKKLKSREAQLLLPRGPELFKRQHSQFHELLVIFWHSLRETELRIYTDVKNIFWNSFFVKNGSHFHAHPGRHGTSGVKKREQICFLLLFSGSSGFGGRQQASSPFGSESHLSGSFIGSCWLRSHRQMARIIFQKHNHQCYHKMIWKYLCLCILWGGFWALE